MKDETMTYPISYQLYSSRNFPPLFSQFAQLKSFGYDAIEPWLPAYEADPKAFRQALDDNGLKCHCFHMPLKGLVNEPNRFIDIALTIGASIMIPPYVVPEERGTTAEYWQGLGGQLSEGATLAAKHGLKVAWHNHDFEFRPLADGSRSIDHILAGGENVWFEIDCGWITRAGGDPAAELQKFADRIIAIQAKDMAPAGTTQDDGWAPTGDGIIDWQKLVPLFRKTKAEHIVTEHDNPSDWRIFAKRSIDYLKKLGL
ncbi:sugar phosphate isomerase/epimerase [Neorhizobium sp. 2083]|uniref:sugar phosphate isomerase/epimerase family protein n=1 Tax=Neorhizobium sp. 2083 TaxID=2817762 RepID=UPI00286569DE|nr:sugar phosphate isomerase/epimerase [Neorhizobium sp. 2083]MDR6819925.1 sugar phosphate isomerase/epimerase [Neorhizobium sp. 2083]